MWLSEPELSAREALASPRRSTLAESTRAAKDGARRDTKAPPVQALLHHHFTLIALALKRHFRWEHRDAELGCPAIRIRNIPGNMCCPDTMVSSFSCSSMSLCSCSSCCLFSCSCFFCCISFSYLNVKSKECYAPDIPYH